MSEQAVLMPETVVVLRGHGPGLSYMDTKQTEYRLRTERQPLKRIAISIKSYCK